MSAAPTDSVAAELLQQRVRDIAPTRERTIARYIGGVALASLLVIVAIVPVIGPSLAWRLLLLVAAVAGYYLGLLLGLRRGWFHPVVPWINVLIEVSIPAVIFVLDLSIKGPSYALTAPPLVLWAVLVALSGLRLNPRLALVAGLVAGLEHLGLYLWLVGPGHPDVQLVTLGPEFVAIRALFLGCAGVLAAILARYYLTQAAEALRVVRERDLFGKYILHERLGSGGMAEVYRATYSPEGGFRKVVAVKRIHIEHAVDKSFIDMFRLEARIGSLLNHPNVVQVLDFGRHGNSYYMALEYVDGVTLADLIRAHGNTLPLAAVAYIGAELGAALSYIHARPSDTGAPLGLVHRDLNPPNILLSGIGEVKLSDFGIASVVGRARMTQAGYVRGKANYLSPEQIRGEPFDGRADLFALGVTLYEAVNGQTLFGKVPGADSGAHDLLLQRALWRQDLSPELEDIIRELLTFDAGMRTPTGDALRRRLLALQGEIAPYPQGQAIVRKAVAATLEWKAKQHADAVATDVTSVG